MSDGEQTRNGAHAQNLRTFGNGAAFFCVHHREEDPILNTDSRGLSRTLGENPVLNTILASLPDHEFEALRSHLEWQSLPLITVLVEPGSPLLYGYFLNDGLASAVVPTGS